MGSDEVCVSVEKSGGGEDVGEGGLIGRRVVRRGARDH
jgi:hypothetical protein